MSTSDQTQSTCVFVGLKKGVERTRAIISEVIQRMKDAVAREFGQLLVLHAYFVSWRAYMTATEFFKSYVLKQKLLFFSRSLSCFPEHFLGKTFASHWKVLPKTHQWKGNKKLPYLRCRNIVVLTSMECFCVSQITILYVHSSAHIELL